MGRQAILERLGWKFVRIRGSLFFRDEERAMESVFRRLDDLTIAPSSVGTIAAASIEDPVIEVVKRRAQELRQFWHQAATEGLPELLVT